MSAAWSPRTKWRQCDFVAIDVEGNGALPQEIIEVAAVSVRDGQVGDVVEWKVRPRVPVSEQAMRVHGISNAELAGQPDFETVASEVKSEISAGILIGHNLAIDIQMLQRQLPQWRAGTYLDTLRLGKSLFPDAPSFSLEALCRYAGVTGQPKFHRAAVDALATAKLFVLMATMMSSSDEIDLIGLAHRGARADDAIFSLDQGSLF